jgi:hypothetical protein
MAIAAYASKDIETFRGAFRISMARRLPVTHYCRARIDGCPVLKTPVHDIRCLRSCPIPKLYMGG